MDFHFVALRCLILNFIHDFVLFDFNDTNCGFTTSVYLSVIPRSSAAGIKGIRIQLKGWSVNLLSSLCGGASHAPQLCCGVRRRNLTSVSRKDYLRWDNQSRLKAYSKNVDSSRLSHIANQGFQAEEILLEDSDQERI